jgi:hypothetical protein
MSLPTEKTKGLKSLLENYPRDWPPKEYFVHESMVTKRQIKKLKELIENKSGETEIDDFIRRHPVVLTMLLDFLSTGHHGAWVIPKKIIRSKVSANMPGLIPDFIVGGRSSSGFAWVVFELKGIKDNLFTVKKNNLSFTSFANRGICQLLDYIDFCGKAQSYIRDILKLTDFREPKGFLIIGTEDELDNERKKDLKAAWNRNVSKLHIRSYSALLRSGERMYNSYHKKV